MPRQHHIVALIYPDFETLDLFGPLGIILPRSDYYTLTLASLNPDASPDALESSMKNGIITSPTISLSAAQELDFTTLFIPGGFGMSHFLGERDVILDIGKLVDRAAHVFTVCTGSILLAATTRLDGRKATTNKRLYNQLTVKYPNVEWQARARWVQDGKFLTSSGVTAGMDAAFAFIANTYVGPTNRKDSVTAQEVSLKASPTVIPGFDKAEALDEARRVAFALEYRWHEDPADDPFVREDEPGERLTSA
ncbi:MAG: hypothetical protein Q9222_005846 [Ikaeria aurantiellina]